MKTQVIQEHNKMYLVKVINGKKLKKTYLY